MNPSFGFSQRRKQLFASLILTLGIAGVLALAATLRGIAPQKGTLIAVGRPVPPGLFVSGLLGRRVSLASISGGKRRIIAFYSPTCGACQDELPELRPIPAGIELVMIKEQEKPGLDALSSGLSVYSDSEKVLTRAFAFPALPTLLFIDERGVVRDGLIGTHLSSVTRGKLDKFAALH